MKLEQQKHIEKITYRQDLVDALQYIWRKFEVILNRKRVAQTIYDNKHAPLKKVPKRKVNYIYKPWITKQILPNIIAKNKLAAKRHRNPRGYRV